jgi:hypothetical protein
MHHLNSYYTEFVYRTYTVFLAVLVLFITDLNREHNARHSFSTIPISAACKIC